MSTWVGVDIPVQLSKLFSQTFVFLFFFPTSGNEPVKKSLRKGKAGFRSSYSSFLLVQGVTLDTAPLLLSGEIKPLWCPPELANANGNLANTQHTPSSEKMPSLQFFGLPR